MDTGELGDIFGETCACHGFSAKASCVSVVFDDVSLDPNDNENLRIWINWIRA